MLIEATTQTVYGNVYALAGNDDLNVASGVLIRSLGSSPDHNTEYDAILAYQGQNRITVSGTVKGYDDGINTIGSEAAQTVEIMAGGHVFSGYGSAVVDADGVILDGLNSSLANHGIITAQGSGVMLSTREFGTTVVANYGTINAEKYGIWVQYSFGTASFTNFGRVESGLASYLGGARVDLVTNAGVMSGDVDLGQGNDVYVGTEGRVIGTIYGSWGDDSFVTGRYIDRIDGGDGIDTLDFSGSATAVHVDLTDAANNSGQSAFRDTYTGIETILGSGRNDMLTGDAQANTLAGNAGVDRLIGNDGNDTLDGGAARDVLTGGAGFDTFVFRSAAEARDEITDFSSQTDLIALDGAAFGYAGQHGAIDPADFVISTRAAGLDATDHFIFRTTDATLWYDADGAGGALAVLLANLNDDVMLGAGNIQFL
ncbi:MAG: calcium-binding protein [Pseudomonadota bacterium]